MIGSSMPTARAARLAVLGSPIAHSLSPGLHRAAYEVLGVEWSYEAFDVPSPELTSFISGLGSDWRGLSLTMPLKHTVLPLLDSRDRLSVLTGSTNTVLFTPDEGGRRLLGFNTDVGGIVRALAAATIEQAREVVILGGGATAASAIVAAAQLGAEHVSVLARSPEKAESLRDIAHDAGTAVTVLPLTLASLELVDASLVISTLPGDAAPVELMNASTLPSRTDLLDVAYHPWPSALGALWESSKRIIVPGIDMLLHQALLQIRIFIGGDPVVPLPDEATVLAAMSQSLGDAGERSA